jgi:nucleoside-diphosphate-sugar epimerase
MTAPLALVTGAPGWLGSRLVEVLVKGLPDVPGLAEPLGERTVRCLVHGGDAAALRGVSDRVEIVEGDLTQPASLGPFFAGAAGATLFHCAGVIHPTQGIRELIAVNVDGARHLVAGARGAHVRRMVHVSSNSPIGIGARPDDIFDESSPYRPYMSYGKSKRLAEDIVREGGAEGALETVIIRPPWFYGPGQPPRQGLFFTMIKEGKAPLVGRGDNLRSMAYIDNICQGLLLCERVDQARGQVYWIADRRPYAFVEIIDTIETVLEKDFGIEVAHGRMRLPHFVGDVARVVDGALQALGLYQQKIHVLSEMNATIACNVAKAVRELGYDPKVELAEGMRRSIQWMLDGGMTI